MKKRIISFLILFCLLVSIVPQSAFAAFNGYGIYVNGTEFTMARKTINGITFDVSSETLTFDNVRVSSGSDNVVIQVDRSIRILFTGTNIINLSDSSDRWRTAFKFSKSVYMQGNTGSSLTINAAVKDCKTAYDKISGVELYRTGIISDSTDGVTMSGMNITMNDNSDSSKLGHSALIDMYNGNLSVQNSKLTARNLYCGIITDKGNTNYTLTEFNFYSDITDSHGIATSYGNSAKNTFRNVKGTISADYGIRCFGATEFTVASDGVFDVTGKSCAIYCDRNEGIDPPYPPYPEVAFLSGTFNLKGGNGIILEGESKAYIGGGSGRPIINIDTTEAGIMVGATAGEAANFQLVYGELNIKNALAGISVNAGATFKALDGSISIVGNGASESFGVTSRGTVTLNCFFDISNYEFGLYTLKSSGYDSKMNIGGSGTQNISAVTAGIYLVGGDTVIERKDSDGYRSLTINAPYGIANYYDGSTCEIKSGTINLNSGKTGIMATSNAGKMKISGGKLTIAGTAANSSTSGILASGELEISGTADISFSNNNIDFKDVSGKGKMTGGSIHLTSGGIGMYLTGDYEISGGRIDSTSNGEFSIIHEKGTLKLSGGEIDITGSSIGLTAYGNSKVLFCGTDVSLETTNQVAFYGTSNANNSYEISGGTIELKGANYAANFSFSGSLPAGYMTLAGNDKNSASSISNPPSSVAISHKYVKFTPPTPYTLTLENVAEGTTATVNSGASFTYTAAEAPVGKHFDHWEMKSGDGSFTSVGTNATYTGTMPASNATLKAVYADCRFDAKIENYDNFADNATCEHGTIYYYSCSVCGDSARFVDNGPTFESGEKSDHEWSMWFSNNDGKTHSRACANNNQHRETEDCSGGSATCTSKAVCSKCSQQYGDLAAHSFTSQNTDSKYLENEATCSNKATYYYSCSACGAKGTNTFEAGEKLDHTWGNWISQGDGTHKRVCSANSSHVEIVTCSGGSATTESKAICTVCGGEYGSLVPKNVSVTIPTIATLAGNEVTVSVLITSNPGLSHFEATITYDSSVLTLVSVSNGSFFDSSAFNVGTVSNNGTYKITFDSNSDVTKDSGVLVDLKFKVKDGAAVGTYPISVLGTVIGKNAVGSTVDCVISDGGIKVAKPSSGVLGDVDGDGKVSAKDLLLFKRYLNGTVSNAEMFYADCADIDGDGRISTKDLLRLKQYLSGVISF